VFSELEIQRNGGTYCMIGIPGVWEGFLDGTDKSVKAQMN